MPIPGDPTSYGLPPGSPMPQQAQGAGGMLDPQLIQAILGMRGQPMQMQQQQRQLKLADQMRADAGQQLKGTQAGRVYKAPNALNVGANVLGNFMAARSDNAVKGAEGQMMQADQDAARRYYEAIMQQQMMGRQQPMPMPQAGPTNPQGGY
jgi:hypothetical protein